MRYLSRPPLYIEPGWNMHSPEEIGIDAFQTTRSYRTALLRGLSARSKGGFYHDGRFETLGNVVQHYDSHLKTNLNPIEMADPVEFLRSL